MCTLLHCACEVYASLISGHLYSFSNVIVFQNQNSVQPLFLLKEMHFKQQQNKTRLKLRIPASLRDLKWAKFQIGPFWVKSGCRK